MFVCVYVCVWRLGCVCGEVVEEGDMFGWMREKLRGCGRRFHWGTKGRDGLVIFCVCGKMGVYVFVFVCV